MLNRHFKEIIAAFNAERVEYLLVGAYALAAHGVPRATSDIDFWVRPTRENADRTWRALARFGAPMERVTRDDLATPEMIVQFGVEPQRIDVLTTVDGVTFDDAYARRVTVTMDGLQVAVIDREHLILSKRAAGRGQDLVDADRLEGLERRRSE